MSEVQIPQIRISKDNLHSNGCDCGGAYRVVDVEICVDSEADPYTQKVALIHEILGAYLGTFIQPETLTEIAEQIIDGLETAYPHKDEMPRM